MDALHFIGEFKKYNLGPYIEVPCSVLTPLIESLMKDKECDVINPVNEAVAMGIAAGSFLATKKIPVVLMQNSGLCNTLNALTSLNQIYKIPVLYLISWRGRPGQKDAPEHSIIGEKLEEILRVFNIPFEVLSEKDYKSEIRKIDNILQATQKPAAILIGRGLIEKRNQNVNPGGHNFKLSRSKAVSLIIKATHYRSVYISTNGYISREAFYHLSSLEKDNLSFYMLGSMGHALSIALGMGKYLSEKKKIIVLDGDGGCLMHLGAMASVGAEAKSASKIIHVVLDNRIYASTGGQPSVAGSINFLKIAGGCGYKNIYAIKTGPYLKKILEELLYQKGPSFVQVQIEDKYELPKPRVSDKYSCEAIKERFIKQRH